MARAGAGVGRLISGTPGARRDHRRLILSERQPAEPRDAFAAHLGVAVERVGPDEVVARLTPRQEHTNPHGTVHGTVLFSLAGIAIAALANDAAHSGVVSSVHIDYLRPARPGHPLIARATVAERLPREDLFTVRVLRDVGGDSAAETGGDVVARATARATRRARTAVPGATGGTG